MSALKSLFFFTKPLCCQCSGDPDSKPKTFTLLTIVYFFSSPDPFFSTPFSTLTLFIRLNFSLCDTVSHSPLYCTTPSFLLRHIPCNLYNYALLDLLLASPGPVQGEDREFGKVSARSQTDSYAHWTAGIVSMYFIPGGGLKIILKLGVSFWSFFLFKIVLFAIQCNDVVHVLWSWWQKLV